MTEETQLQQEEQEARNRYAQTKEELAKLDAAFDLEHLQCRRYFFVNYCQDGVTKRRYAARTPILLRQEAAIQDGIDAREALLHLQKQQRDQQALLDRTPRQLLPAAK